jgi:hypothetical protein
VLHEVSRPIDLEELAVEGEGLPVGLTRRPEYSGERAGVTCIKRISPTVATFAPTAIDRCQLGFNYKSICNFDSKNVKFNLQKLLIAKFVTNFTLFEPV